MIGFGVGVEREKKRRGKNKIVWIASTLINLSEK